MCFKLLQFNVDPPLILERRDRYKENQLIFQQDEVPSPYTFVILKRVSEVVRISSDSNSLELCYRDTIDLTLVNKVKT